MNGCSRVLEHLRGERPGARSEGTALEQSMGSPGKHREGGREGVVLWRGRRGEVRTEAAESPPRCLIRWVMPMLLAGDPTLRTAGRGWGAVDTRQAARSAGFRCFPPAAFGVGVQEQVKT